MIGCTRALLSDCGAAFRMYLKMYFRDSCCCWMESNHLFAALTERKRRIVSFSSCIVWSDHLSGRNLSRYFPSSSVRYPMIVIHSSSCKHDRGEYYLKWGPLLNRSETNRQTPQETNQMVTHRRAYNIMKRFPSSWRTASRIYILFLIPNIYI